MREYEGNKDLSVEKLIDFIPTFYPYCEYQAINLGIQRKDHNIVTYWDDYIQNAKDCGYKFLSWNIWARPSAGSVGNQSAFFPIQHEWVFVFGKKFKDINRTAERVDGIAGVRDYRKGKKTRQADGSTKKTSVGKQEELKEMGSVLFMNPELGSIRSEHPATFPVEFPSEYIKAMTDKHDVIAEPFSGSGTTMVASHQLKRKCYGMELEPKYCDVIVRRMIKLDSDLVIKRNGVVIDHSEFGAQ
jgi:DNA modification methylase